MSLIRPRAAGGGAARARPAAGPLAPADALIAGDPPFLVFHQWLLVASTSVFALFMAARGGGLGFIVENDSTYISEAILLIFAVTTLYCGARSWRLGAELLDVQRAATGAPADGAPGLVSAFLRLAPERPDADRAMLTDAFTERLRGPHEVGWFITETLTKLGLLGTVVGFLIMLSALIGTGQIEISAMQAILREMAAGMGIKIIATVVGLLCNMVLALQWLLLDRCADKILSGAAYLVARGGAGAARSPATAGAVPAAA